jgi:hypothetical protein
MRVPMQYFFVLSILSFLALISYYQDIEVKYRLPLVIAYFICIGLSLFLGEILVKRGIYGGADVKYFMSVMGILFIMGMNAGLLYALWFFVLTPLPEVIMKAIKVKSNNLTLSRKYPFIPVMTLVLIALFFYSMRLLW